LSMREPTVLIGARELPSLGAEVREAFAGCEVNAKETTTAATKAQLITRISTFPFPRSRLTDWPLSLAQLPGSRASSNAEQ
jgi:hypothetical protein